MWSKELSGIHTPEVDQYGITSFVYKRRLPFHPERFHEFTQNEWPGVVRAKGYFWLAGREEDCHELSQARPFLKINAAGNWWASIEKNEWPLSNEWGAWLSQIWDVKVGDRRQELVFIGIGMDTNLITSLLDDCLLTEEEAEKVKEGLELVDPFPAWEYVNA